MALTLGVQSAEKTMTEKCKADPTDSKSDFKDCTNFNILSLTQAGDDGYMTARFLEYMEQAAYYIARSMLEIPIATFLRETRRISQCLSYLILLLELILGLS